MFKMYMIFIGSAPRSNPIRFLIKQFDKNLYSFLDAYFTVSEDLHLSQIKFLFCPQFLLSSELEYF